AVYLGTTIGALTNDSLKATPKWYWVAGLVATLVVLLVLVQISKHAIARVTGVKPTPQPPVTWRLARTRGRSTIPGPESNTHTPGSGPPPGRGDPARRGPDRGRGTPSAATGGKPRAGPAS